MMSYMTFFPDDQSNLLTLGMLADAPLETFLREHPNVEKIMFFLDNDEPGREAAEKLCEKYYQLGYAVDSYPIPKEYNDLNDWLVAEKERLPEDRVEQYQNSKML